MGDRFRYKLDKPRVLRSWNKVELLSMNADWEREEVVLRVRIMSKRRDVTVQAVRFPLSKYDAFVDAASRLPGTTAEEKIIRELPNLAPADFPAGGTVEMVSGGRQDG